MLTDDERQKLYFLDTGKTQPEVIKILHEYFKTECDMIVGAYKRYKMITTMVLFYTTQDIEQGVRDNSRVTDLVHAVKIGDAFFTMAFLIFTTSDGGWKFAENLAYRFQNKNIHCRYYADTIDDAAYHNISNFIGNFLFEIKDQPDCFNSQ